MILLKSAKEKSPLDVRYVCAIDANIKIKKTNNQNRIFEAFWFSSQPHR